MNYSVTDSLGYIVNLTARVMSHSLRKRLQASGSDLTAEQWGILACLQQRDGCNQMELAHEHFKDKANITRIVDGLERRGLVERQQDPQDRRNNRIFLTTKGREIYRKLLPIVTGMLQQAYAGMTTEEIQKLKEQLRQVHRNLTPKD